MNKKSLLIPGIVTIALIVMISGCIGGSQSTDQTTNPTTSASAVASSSASNKITVTETDSAITITGGKCNNAKSDTFTLSKNDWYVVKTSDNLIAPTITSDQGESILLPYSSSGTSASIIGKSSSDLDVAAEITADGPWTIEFLKSPKPSPVSTDTKFSGTDNDVTPYFHLNQGSATFTMNFKSESQGSLKPRIWVNLYNADTGEQAGEIESNVIPGEYTSTKDIPADGNYVLSVSSFGTWDVSYSQ